MPDALLRVVDLETQFRSDRGVARAVDRVSFAVAPSQVVGLVGESGCGKSVTALTLMRLVPSPAGRITGGQIWFEGRDLLALSEVEMRAVRGSRLAMIFQEPMTSLNPVFRVGDQIVEMIRRHTRRSKVEALEQAVALLHEVGIAEPERRVRAYPHQLSGGMRQRVMIAMALACRPRLLIADEPTTALDVTIQAQILDLLLQLRQDTATAILLITHDLGVVAQTADRVLVMYAGRVVEEAGVDELFGAPLHPYTQGLLRSIPAAAGERSRRRLEAIPGAVPDLLRLPQGCKFNDRCPRVFELCRDREPELLAPATGHPVRCWLYGG